jgi:STE24 endopeptidase
VPSRPILVAALVLCACVPPVGDPDVADATARWLATVSPEARARSDAYFEGGYAIWLASFLYGAAVYLFVLRSRLSAWLRDRAAALTSSRALQPAIYWVGFLVAVTVLMLPSSIWTGFLREHEYGLSNETFAAWLVDRGKGLAVGIVAGGLAVAAIYAVVRRTGRRWWLWASGVAVAFAVVGLTITPVFLAPIFNRYERLEDGPVRESVLRMARANGIAATEVWKSDASRQSTRISANVSGMLGTERITLNDNLLARCSQEEIEAVMGHEMGHYVLNHVYEGVLFTSVLLVAGFAFVAAGYERVRRRWGERWGIAGPDDPAGLPLFALLLSTWFFALEPITNSYTRAIEQEADVFGLNAARRPDGFASVALQLAEYRKLDPGVVEEMLFYDHPSGRVRIETAMRWKKANEPDAPLGPR